MEHQIVGGRKSMAVKLVIPFLTSFGLSQRIIDCVVVLLGLSAQYNFAIATCLKLLRATSTEPPSSNSARDWEIWCLLISLVSAILCHTNLGIQTQPRKKVDHLSFVSLLRPNLLTSEDSPFSKRLFYTGIKQLRSMVFWCWIIGNKLCPLRWGVQTCKYGHSEILSRSGSRSLHSWKEALCRILQMIGLQGSIYFLFFNKEVFLVIAPVPKIFLLGFEIVSGRCAT